MRARLPWLLGGLAVFLIVESAVASAIDSAPAGGQLTVGQVGWDLTHIVFACVGALVAARRPEHRMGWVMLAAGLVNGFALAVVEYGWWTLVVHPGSLPGGDVAAWLAAMTFAPAIAAIDLVAVYFPTGELPSRRWRWLPVVIVAGGVTTVVATGIGLWPVNDGAALLSAHGDPLQGTLAGAIAGLGWLLVGLLGPVAAMVGIVVRYVRARGAERLQLKWLMVAAIVSAPFVVLPHLLPADTPARAVADAGNSPVLLAVAVALAVLRYRIYDIDRIVSRTVTYAVVTACVVGIYVGIVVTAETVIGSSSSVAVAASTLVAAAVFQPLRRRVQAMIDRRFNRPAYDARRTVDAFASRLRDDVYTDTVRDDLLSTVETAVAPAHVGIWLVPT